MKPPKVYTIFDLPKGEEIDCSRDTPITKQSFADECDINQIMARYEATGYIDPLSLQQRQAIYADFTSGTEFTDLQDSIVRARTAFEALPANIRTRFANDPAQLLDFIHNPDNEEEAVKLGLLTRTTEEPKPAPPAKEPDAPKPDTK